VVSSEVVDPGSVECVDGPVWIFLDPLLLSNSSSTTPFLVLPPDEFSASGFPCSSPFPFVSFFLMSVMLPSSYLFLRVFVFSLSLGSS
jgi:hypothetical protein